MKIVTVLLSLVLLSACAGGGGSSADGGATTAAVDPIHGAWYYLHPGSTETQATATFTKIDPDGKVEIVILKSIASGNARSFIYRQLVGTYQRTGSEFKVSYSYETCSPVGSETFMIYPSGDKLFVDAKNQGVQYLLAKVDQSTPSSTVTGTMVEDKGCSLL